MMTMMVVVNTSLCDCGQEGRGGEEGEEERKGFGCGFMQLSIQGPNSGIRE